MKHFIAYFDLLGFKEFIMKNTPEYHEKIMGNIFRDMESALSKGKTKEISNGYIADISKSRVNCINFSDTVIFWISNENEDIIKELLDVVYRYNWQAIRYFFPARGCLYYGEIKYVNFNRVNDAGGVYNINSIYGKVLVDVYLKAESQNWAGTVIDNSVLERLVELEIEPDSFLAPYAVKYNVPYKDGSNKEEFAL